ncbi:MAG TPA: histidine kinase N-terminal 7TM domain-containing protein, partial [Anaerolineae bacterium]|nr:histidine kinase N-terminal 7TM domain-containing protein [Anaerolineae bacterium]
MCQYSLYVTLAPLAVVMAVGVLMYARRYRHTTPGDTAALHWLTACIVGWIALDAFELVARTEAATLFWARASYLFIAGAPVAWFAFALDHWGRREWHTPIKLAILGIAPVGMVILAMTNAAHGLIWREYQFVRAGDLLAMQVVSHGPAFWLWVAGGYILVAAGSLLIIRRSLTSFHLYRHQSRLMVVGALIPILFNLAYLFHLIPGLRKDYTPISFALASSIFVIAMIRYRLFEVKPIARNVVIDTLQDPVLALDTMGRLVDL